jgi:methylated-DNA-[protein]-cysteine S-methyltransferase
MSDTIHHHLFDTAIGACGIAWSARGLVAVQLPESDDATTEQRLVKKSGSAGAAEPPATMAKLIGDIRKYLAGERMDFSAVPVDLEAIDGERRRLYEALREIGYGATTTYGELAKRLGATDWEGARNVGEAMGKNPVPVVIPCHRVLAAGKKIGGFSAYGGTKTKEKLLALEGVRFERAAPKPSAPKASAPKASAPRLPGL